MCVCVYAYKDKSMDLCDICIYASVFRSGMRLYSFCEVSQQTGSQSLKLIIFFCLNIWATQIWFSNYGISFSIINLKMDFFLCRMDKTPFGHMILAQGGVTVWQFLLGLLFQNQEVQILLWYIFSFISQIEFCCFLLAHVSS